MAAVARGMTTDKRSAEGARKELSRKAVATIGRAPRCIVCFNCAGNNEIILGRIDSEKPCERCRRSLKQGVIVQAPAMVSTELEAHTHEDRSTSAACAQATS